MAKSQAAVTGSLIVANHNAILAVEGTLVSQTETSIVLDVRRYGSGKTDRTEFPLSAVAQAFLNEEKNGSWVYTRGTSEESHEVTRLEVTVDGWFMGENEGGSVLAAPGTWKFMPAVTDETATAAAPKGKGKAAAEPAAIAPKGKGKVAAEPAAEDDPDDGEGEGGEEAFVPEVGALVTITDDDEDEFTGTVLKIVAKTGKITIEDDAGEPSTFIMADVTIVAAEAAEEYEPATGDYVKLLDDEGDVIAEGTIDKLTAKLITIDGETHKLTEVDSIELAEAPKAKGKGKAAAAEPAAAKGKGKAAAEPEAAEDW